MIKKRFRRCLGGMLLLAGLCLSRDIRCEAEVKTNNELQLNIEEDAKAAQTERWLEYKDGSLCLRLYYGQDGVLRAGRDVPVSAELTAYEASFEGTLQILMLNEEENHIAYEVEISASEGEKGAAELILPMNLLTGALYMTLAETNGTTIVEQMLYPEIINYGTYLNVGIMLPEGSADYLASFGNKIDYIGKSNLKSDYRALDAYDVLVIKEQEMKVLGVMESRALQQWVEQGRMLIITVEEGEGTFPEAALNLGLQENTIVQGLVEHISAYEAERNAVLIQNEEQKKKYGLQAKQTYIGSSMLGPVLVNTLSDEAIKQRVTMPVFSNTSWWNTPESEVLALWEERNIPILQQFSCGDGIVEYVAFSLETPQTEIYPLFYYRLAELLYANIPGTLMSQLEYELCGMSRSEPMYLLEFFEKKGERISVLPYVIILAIYLCVCLPFLFWWLKRKGMSKYLWGVFPITAMLFLMLIYGVGRKTRVQQAFCTYLNIIDYTATGEPGRLYFDVSLPTHQATELTLGTKAQVTFADTLFASYNADWNMEPVLPEHILQERKARLEVLCQEEKTKLRLQKVAAFSKTAIWAEYTPQLCPELLVKATLEGDGLTGILKNESTQEFESGLLLVDSILVKFGVLAPGETLKLEEQSQFSLRTGERYSEEMIDWFFGEEGSDAHNKENGCVWFVMEELWNREIQEEYLVVFTSSPDCTPLGTLANAEHSAGMTAMIFPVEAE